MEPAQKQQVFTIREAAHLLGIGKLKLFKTLRQLYILDASNVPYPDYVRDGYFKIEQRNFWHKELQKYVPYAKAMVTVHGLNWLNDKLAKELPHGRNDQDPPLIS